VLYLTAKAVHILGFISWFAGLFYLVRLFIYHAEAGAKSEPERSILQAQLQTMQARLWKIITLPAMVITFVAGITMVVMIWPGERWLHYKFVWLALLVAYTFACGAILRRQRAGTSAWTSARLRVFNEVATLLMAAIVFLAVFRSSMSAVWGALGLLGLGIALMLGIRLYRRLRTGSETSAA
jgi:putative membrane protein